MSAAMPDMLELQYELESKAAKWYATIDIANAFFLIPLAAECRPQFAFTWRGIQYTWNRLPQGWKHSPTIFHGLIQSALEKGEAPEHLQYIDDIIVWGNSAEEVSEKGKKIIQILLQAGFTIKRRILEVIMDWPEGKDFGMSPEEEVMHAEEVPPYNELPKNEKQYALFTDGSCRIVGKHWRWKAAVWSPTQQATEAAEGQGESSQFAEVKAIQLALGIAEREKWSMLYLYTDSWMVANALWGWLQQWKKQSNWQRRGKPIWAAPLWQDVAAQLEKLVVKVRHVDAHIPKSQATEEHQNNQQVDQAAKIEEAQVDLDWQHKGTVATQTLATDTVATQTPVTGTASELKNQSIPVSVTPIQKKKYTKKSVRLVKDDDEPGPSQEQEEEPEPEVITRSLSLSELRDMRKDFSHHPGEHIVTWLLRCWDNGASSLELEGREAKQLGSLSREGGIDKAIGKKAQALSLWRRLLSSVRERYPFSKDVICRPGKRTTMERGIQYLRELAVREMVYYDPNKTQLLTDPHEAQCT
ncbi:hypothetical protein GRJ2_003406800 [Grus japonensis]|uniref:ribonuclease H n=1 Tax=Grus japonensis TaxID=30415 RepID=A0ABC9YHL2_GRUJA